MAQLVEVPGVGTVEFPDGMSEQQMAAAIAGMRPQQQSFGNLLAHQGGLFARNMVQGMASPATAFIGDPIAGALNLGVAGINNLTGAQLPRFDYPSQNISRGLSAAGLPEPQNRAERVVGEITQAGAGALGLGGAANLLRGAATQAPSMGQQAINMLADKPGAQLTAGAASAVASDIARESNLSPGAQLAVGLGAGIVAPHGGNVASQAGRVREIVRPFTQAGREAITGQALNRFATNAERARANIQSNVDIIERPIVPGSRPMTAGVAQDAGLAAIQDPIAKILDERNMIGQRVSENNAARVNMFDQMARDEQAVAYAQAKRDRVTGPMREDAFAQSNATPQTLDAAITTVVMPHIDNVLASPAGKRQDVQQAMQWARSRLSQQVNSLDDLYEIRKDLRAATLGRYDGEAPSLRLARRELNGLISEVDSLIESGAPGYRDYLSRYSRMSRPIEQMETLQDIRGKSMLAAPDPVSGMDIFSQAKLKSQLQARSDELGQTLSATQRARVNAILSDLNRASASTSAVARRPGSDTFKNYSVANLIGALFSEKMADNAVLRTLTRPLDFLYKLPDQKVADLLVEAMLDPKLAADLMRKGSVLWVEPVAKSLRRKAYETGIVAPSAGAVLGALE